MGARHRMRCAPVMTMGVGGWVSSPAVAAAFTAAVMRSLNRPASHACLIIKPILMTAKYRRLKVPRTPTASGTRFTAMRTLCVGQSETCRSEGQRLRLLCGPWNLISFMLGFKMRGWTLSNWTMGQRLNSEIQSWASRLREQGAGGDLQEAGMHARSAALGGLHRVGRLPDLQVRQCVAGADGAPEGQVHTAGASPQYGLCVMVPSFEQLKLRQAA